MTDELAIEQRYSDLAGLLDGLNCGLIGRAPDGAIVYANEHLLKLTGYTRDELMGRDVREFIPDELHPVMEDEIRKVEQGDLRGRLIAVRRKDGTTFPALLLPQRFLDAKGRFSGALGVVIDLGTIQTAKHLGAAPEGDLRATLAGIATQLQSISAMVGSSTGPAPALPLAHPALAALSPREVEVLTRLVEGKRVPVIAKELFISQHTVRNHLKSMYRKLEIKTQSELIERVRELQGEAG